MGPIAQSVEQRTFNPWVDGSSPSGPTFSSKLASEGVVVGMHRLGPKNKVGPYRLGPFGALEFPMTILSVAKRTD